MLAQQDTLAAQDGTAIPYRHWPCQKPRAVIQISHGMAEHSKRYAPLAQAFNQAGFATIAHDHRGHGHNRGRKLGHFADEKGWQKVTSDLAAIGALAHELYPGTPVFLLAHSMGSFIALGSLEMHPSQYAGIILSGSEYTTPLKFKAALPIAKTERLVFGPTGRSPVMSFLSFGSYNQGINQRRTRFDWLSRDPVQVDKYLQDPFCGFDCTNQLWVDLLGGLSETFAHSNLKRLPKVPFYLFAGTRDPVGRYGEGVKDLFRALQKAGIEDATLQLYPEGRHEMLNETNREEVIAQMLTWINQHIT